MFLSFLLSLRRASLNRRASLASACPTRQPEGRAMTWRILAAAFLVLAAAPAAWLAQLPAPVHPAAPPVPAAEQAGLIEALRPPKRTRPLIAIVAINDATEVTDYLVPAGILRRAGVADVMLLATGPGPVRLYPALRVRPDATIADFDRARPQGPDYVIVPAMSREDPQLLDWLRRQADSGATVVAVCAGARVAAAAGLLDGKRAVTHWYYLPGMLKRHPDIRHVPDRRMVADRGVATTTGITASIPMMLTLTEAIAGRGKAEAVARELGLASWDASHASAGFRLTHPFATTVLANRAQFWRREELALPLRPGMDEVTLALSADAWSRTYRSAVVGVAAAPVVTANGIAILPDRASGGEGAGQVPAFADRPPAAALDLTLEAIGRRYGPRTADVVAMQLEYPGE
ncbi:ThiJ/PfpI domain protein [Paracoccus denitrificans PD1222]|uniref:ThiJ/PfpI domain protein n=2 Tax=Paracoccus denitrificans TaxID=266 RepID=A1BA84_PARDP|nr:ThiJ/PfpI domain protein [Paracoccus denitrificans PD1222]